MLAEATHVEWFATLGASVGIVAGLIFVAWAALFRRDLVSEIAAPPDRARRRGNAA